MSIAEQKDVQPLPRFAHGVPTLDHFRSLLREGIAHLHARRWRQAALSLAAAIELEPNSPDAISNLGVALFSLGDAQRATVCYRKALELDPTAAIAHSNLGQALLSLGYAVEAAASLIKAVELAPEFVDAWVNLGAALNALGSHDAAAEASHRALALSPGNIEAELNLGNAFKQEGMLREAAQCYRRAIALDAKDARGFNNLGETMRDQADIPGAVEAYEAALAADPGCAAAFSNLLYLHAFTRDVAPETELVLARQYERSLLTSAELTSARAAASPTAGVFAAEPLGAGVARRKLRLGIVSAELGAHAVAEFLEPVLTALDRARFHLTLFATAGRCGTRAARLQALADSFIPLTSLRDVAAVDRIRREHIDVLIDTSGHTRNNRLGIFARRAAPVQCTWIGYWSTTGLTEMDFSIVDRDLPAACEAHFAERLWRLPRIANCYRGDRSLAIGWQPHPRGKIRIGSFAKFAKIREATCALWAEALRAVPDSVLLLEDRGRHEGESHGRIRAAMSAHGIAEHRIEFLPYEPGHERHMHLYQQLDIALDTVPFNGGTTTFDALWMGVPLVTVEGNSPGARMSRSALNALGRPEWIARSHAEFADIVAGLAGACLLDSPTRIAMREAVREQMAASPLCDADSLTCALEDALIAMYGHWLASARSAPSAPRFEPVGATGWHAPAPHPAA